MRLYRFVNEATDRYEELNVTPEELGKIIQKNCTKYLKETKGKWFQRGMEIRLDPKIPGGYRKTRQNRRSLGMDQNIFKKLNSWLVKNGHVDRSKAIMCSREARPLFGRPFYVFIEGDYKYTWLEAEDINTDTDVTGWYGTMVDEFLDIENYEDKVGMFWGPPHLRNLRNKELQELHDLGVPMGHPEFDELDRKHNERVKKWLKENFASFFHTNKQIHMAYANNAEIWFQCKGYYFIRADDVKTYSIIKRIVK